MANGSIIHCHAHQGSEQEVAAVAQAQGGRDVEGRGPVVPGDGEDAQQYEREHPCGQRRDGPGARAGAVLRSGSAGIGGLDIVHITMMHCRRPHRPASGAVLGWIARGMHPEPPRSAGTARINLSMDPKIDPTHDDLRCFSW